MNILDEKTQFKKRAKEKKKDSANFELQLLCNPYPFKNSSDICVLCVWHGYHITWLYLDWPIGLLLWPKIIFIDLMCKNNWKPLALIFLFFFFSTWITLYRFHWHICIRCSLSLLSRWIWSGHWKNIFN